MSSFLDLVLGNPHHVGSFPVLNPRKPLELTNNRAIREFISNSKNILSDARSLYKKKPYRAYTDWGEMIVIPPEFIDPLRSHKQLDFMTPTEDNSHAYVSGFEPFIIDRNSTTVINKHLTKALVNITKPLSQEASLAFSQVLTDSAEWHEINPRQDVVRIVSRMSSRVFMGESLCRDDEWVRVSAEYTVQSFSTGDILRTYPRWSRPFVHWFLPSCWAVRKKLAEARQCLEPHLEHRKAIEAEARAQGKPPPFDDAIAWFEREGSKSHPAQIQISLSLVAIHTTSDLLTETLFNIAQHPDLFQPLREEIVRVLSTEGLKKTSLYNLKLVDSVLKESQRLRPVLLGMFRRQATADVTLPNGDIIKKGEKIMCDTTHMWNPDYYEEATKFDPYRYVRMREASGQDQHPHPHLVSTSFDHLGFGHGKHACPGRFFAANKLKIALCHMLLKYDWKFEDGIRPKSTGFGMVFLMDPQAKLLIKRRTAELDIDSIES
ncbi:putative cytochrome P450 monooxygenase (lovA) [Fusarium heterosporum]|uniref:Putative cytochrome P450 monooxygenase (LovA) n=1 Tax=Fusarium heterosporum TaxID=42747 RepID=A0A8H5WZJ5_FUSHE|nr:putative cytochrome P450 monooxygenase (lovA) [Fusarium heterosporum]